jgi:P-type Cu2+ transporter
MTHCFHCGQEVPVGTDLFVTIDGVDQPMCCLGCQAVAEAIVAEGLEDYYRYRAETPNTPEAVVPEFLARLQVYDREDVQHTFVSQDSDTADQKNASLILENIVCAACAWLSEQHVRKLPGVRDFSVNYMTHRASLSWDDSQIKLSTILQTIADIGFIAHPYDPSRQQQVFVDKRKRMLKKLVVAGLGAMQVMMMAVSLYLGAIETESFYHFLRWVSLVVATPVVLYSASYFYRSAWSDLKAGRAGMDVPVSLAIVLGYSASIWAIVSGGGEVYFDSVTMFTFFLLTGRFIEQETRSRAGLSREIGEELLPITASRRVGEQVEEVSAMDLAVGDTVVIRPGDQVPADGVVIDGNSAVNESLLTGESLPVPKAPGDSLTGGATNVESVLVMRVESTGADMAVSAIARLIERARTAKPEIARIADQVASRFVVIILLLATVTWGYWYFHQPEDALWITISVLIVTCPCALSLATPAAVTVAVSRLANQGMLAVRSDGIEKLARISDVVFDKTGTLTTGKIQVQTLEVLGDRTSAEVMAIAAGLEQHSEHPIARALLEYGQRQQILAASVTEVRMAPGEGVEACVGGQQYRLGTWGFVNYDERSKQEPPIDAATAVVYLGDDNMILARWVLTDAVREDAATTVAALSSLAIRPHIFSGDRREVTHNVASQTGITTYRYAQRPDDKLEGVRAMQQQGLQVAMVGDGVNDAPVLAGADVSIAMGQGASVARLHADFILTSPHLLHIVDAIRVAQTMMRVIKQNFAWAIGYNLLAVPLAFMGLVEPWMAAIGMSVSSLIVILNALRLKK